MSQPNHFYTHTFCQHKVNKTRRGLPIVNCRTQARYSDLFCRKSSLLALYRTLSIVGERFNNLSNYLRSCCIISHHLPQYAIFPLVSFHIVGASQYTVQKSWVWCVCVPPNKLDMKKISLSVYGSQKLCVVCVCVCVCPSESAEYEEKKPTKGQ